MAAPGKKGLALVLGEPKEPEKKAPAKELGEEAEAAQDVIDAIKAGDAEMLSMALRNHYELCSGGGSEEGDEDEEIY